MAHDRDGMIDWKHEITRALSGLGTVVDWKEEFKPEAWSSVRWDALARIHLDVLPKGESVLYQVETKRLSDVRRMDIEAYLARAVLMAQTQERKLDRMRLESAPHRRPVVATDSDAEAHAKLKAEHHDDKELAWEEAKIAQVLAVIQVPSLTRATVEHILAFLTAHVVRTRMAALITSPKGGRIAWFADLPRSATSAVVCEGMPDPFTEASAHQFERAWTGFTFTDTNQKLLKILLFSDESPHVPPRWGRDSIPIKSAEDLSKAGEVALASVYRFRQALKNEGWLQTGREGRWLINKTESILNQWITHVRLLGPPMSIHMRPIWFSKKREDLGAQDELLKGLSEVAPRASRHTWAITGWAAHKYHNLDIVLGPKPLEIVVDGDDSALWHDLRLVPCDERDALVTITRPRAPRSTFWGIITSGGLPYVDAWQAALDVAWDPARGLEQTEWVANGLFGKPDDNA